MAANLSEFGIGEVITNTCLCLESVEDSLIAIKKFEKLTTTKFAIIYSPKDFGVSDLNSKSHKIHWEHGTDQSSTRHLPFNGVPFVILATKTFECQHGPDRNVAKKQQFAEKRKAMPYAKHRFLKHDTKKFGCTATIFLYKVMLFPEYKIQVDSKKRRDSRSSAVRRELVTGSPVKERRFYLCVPSASDHTEHTIGEMGGLLQPVDSTLILKIQELVGQGVRNVGEMKRHIRIYVEKELFRNEQLPSRNNGRFFPTYRTIKNHMYNATMRERVSIMDQENVESLSEKWRGEGHRVEFRPYSAQDEEHGEVHEECVDNEEEDQDLTVGDSKSLSNRLLYVHQSEWQARLLNRYGQEMCFLDATYKTMKYSLPLFFLAVKTNVNYTVVAEFVIQDETTASITEALSVLKSWNPQWNPRHFMTDMCQEEIHSVESLFPECRVLVCTFHREQAWERWTTKRENNVCFKEKLLANLRRVANSSTEEILQMALENLYNSKDWKENEKVRRWLTNTWLKNKERWVCFYRRKRLLVYVHTNNGLERQNGTFKHQYLCTLRKHTLAGMLKILVEEYLPDKYEKYIDANTASSGGIRRYNKQIPEYLHNRPDYLVDHCLKRLSSAADISSQNIKIMDQSTGSFLVNSSLDSVSPYRVSFLDPQNSGFPSCDCADWGKWYLPCKHMMAIIQTEQWQWGQLPVEYRESQFLTLDEVVFFKPATNSIKVDDPDVIYNSESDDTVTVGEGDIVKGIGAVIGTCNMQLEEESASRAQITRCCDLLSSLRNLVYETGSNKALVTLENQLKDARENLERSLQKENGIVLTKCVKKIIRKKKHLAPLTKKFKYRARHPFMSRYGSKASMMRGLFKTNKPLSSYISQTQTKSDNNSLEAIACEMTNNISQDKGEKLTVEEIVSCGSPSQYLQQHEGQGDNCKPQIMCNTERQQMPIKFDRGKKVTNFTPPLRRGRQLVEGLLKFGPIKCSLLHLKSLEPVLPRGVLAVLKSEDSAFKIGWLYDSIIDAFFWMLKQQHPKLLVIESCSMVVLQHRLPSSRILKGEDVVNMDWIMAPWNPTNSHWTLVAVNIKEKTILYLDPLQIVDVNSSIFVGTLEQFLCPFLSKQGLTNFKLLSPSHTLQSDSQSCGVLVCWYARQLILGKSLMDNVVERYLRLDIYRTICGNCLQRLSDSNTRLSKCPLCVEKSSEAMVSCTKCRQWFHCHCIGVSVEDITKRDIFHCP